MVMERIRRDSVACGHANVQQSSFQPESDLSSPQQNTINDTITVNMDHLDDSSRYITQLTISSQELSSSLAHPTPSPSLNE